MQQIETVLDEIEYQVIATVIIKVQDEYLIQLVDRGNPEEDENPTFAFIEEPLIVGESLDDAAKRIIKNKIGINKPKGMKRIGFAEETFFDEAIKKNVQEHVHIFYFETEQELTVDESLSPMFVSRMHLSMLPFSRSYLMQCATQPDQEFYFNRNVRDAITAGKSNIMVMQEAEPLATVFEVRVSAIIIQDGKVFIDQSGEAFGNPVLIGGRMKIGELAIDALHRELKEELAITPNKCTFLGVDENHYQLVFADDRIKVHMLQLFYEVDVTGMNVTPTDEIIFEAIKVEDFLEMKMKMNAAKVFVKKIVQ